MKAQNPARKHATAHSQNRSENNSLRPNDSGDDVPHGLVQVCHFAFGRRFRRSNSIAGRSGARADGRWNGYSQLSGVGYPGDRLPWHRTRPGRRDEHGVDSRREHREIPRPSDAAPGRRIRLHFRRACTKSGAHVLLHAVQRAEESLVLDCQQFCQEHLLLRLYPPERSEVSEFSMVD